MRVLLPVCTFLLAFILVFQSAAAQQYRVDTLARAPFSQYPVSIAFTPDNSGKFFFTEKSSGRVRIYDRTLLPEPFVTVSIEDEGEQGLLGVAVHPFYPDTPFVYIFYTRSIDRSNVVERYRDSSGVGLDPTPVLLVPRQDDGMSNNGGCLHFGPDNKLYVSVGDYGTLPMNAQDISSRRNQRGKILRLNPDGSFPSDNPFSGKPFWSYGHRNPLGFTFDSETGIMYCTESGARAPNELYEVPRGANLGWPTDRIGKMRGPRQPRPLYTFTGQAQPGLTGVICYRGDAFPRLRGTLLFGGNADPTIWVGSFNARGDSVAVAPFFKSNAGYADIEIGFDGCIYFTNGPYISSRILRLAPVAPTFVSIPPLQAKQDNAFVYTPAFNGTPPSLSILAGGERMMIDTTLWSILWKPTNAEALAGFHTLTIRAANGAGFADQTFTVRIENVNDPPGSFTLTVPPDDAVMNFVGNDPLITFGWTPSLDPDLDSVSYTFQIDTVNMFTSPARRDTVFGKADSIRVLMPRRSSDYFWRVVATDGRLFTTSTPPYRKINVAFTTPILARMEKAKESVLEQNFPNPFNPATSIKYTIPHGGRVRLTVFNLLGQEVALLFDGIQTAGTFEVEFNKANLPSGIYFYRIQAPGFLETKKMVITK